MLLPSFSIELPVVDIMIAVGVDIRGNLLVGCNYMLLGSRFAAYLSLAIAELPLDFVLSSRFESCWEWL